MDWKLEIVVVPVTDVDRAKRFYSEQVGFAVDHDTKVSDDMHVVQLTPPGSACSIAVGRGLTEMAPGSLDNLQMVVPDADAVYAHLRELGIEAEGVSDLGWGRFVFFRDPDGNRWSLHELPDHAAAAQG